MQRNSHGSQPNCCSLPISNRFASRRRGREVHPAQEANDNILSLSQSKILTVIKELKFYFFPWPGQTIVGFEFWAKTPDFRKETAPFPGRRQIFLRTEGVPHVGPSPHSSHVVPAHRHSKLELRQCAPQYKFDLGSFVLGHPLPSRKNKGARGPEGPETPSKPVHFFRLDISH